MRLLPKKGTTPPGLRGFAKRGGGTRFMWPELRRKSVLREDRTSTTQYSPKLVHHRIIRRQRRGYEGSVSYPHFSAASLFDARTGFQELVRAQKGRMQTQWDGR